MKLHTAIIIIISSVILAVSTIILGFSYSYNSDEMKLRSKIEMQMDIVDEEFCDLWYSVADICRLPDVYENEFRNICPALLYGNCEHSDADVLKWIKGKNKKFSDNSYTYLLHTIESQRIAFIKDQKILLNYINEHNALINSYPAMWLLKNKAPIYYEPILPYDHGDK